VKEKSIDPHRKQLTVVVPASVNATLPDGKTLGTGSFENTQVPSGYQEGGASERREALMSTLRQVLGRDLEGAPLMALRGAIGSIDLREFSREQLTELVSGLTTLIWRAAERELKAGAVLSTLSPENLDVIRAGVDSLTLENFRQASLNLYGLRDGHGALEFDKYVLEFLDKVDLGVKKTWVDAYTPINLFQDETLANLPTTKQVELSESIHGKYWEARKAEIEQVEIIDSKHLLLGQAPFQSLAEAKRFLGEFVVQDSGSWKSIVRFFEKLEPDTTLAPGTKLENYKLYLGDILPEKRVAFFERFGGSKDLPSVKAMLGRLPEEEARLVQIYNGNAAPLTRLLDGAAPFERLNAEQRLELLGRPTAAEKARYLETIGKTVRLTEIVNGQIPALVPSLALSLTNHRWTSDRMDELMHIQFAFRDGADGYEKDPLKRLAHRTKAMDQYRLRAGEMWRPVIDWRMNKIANPEERFMRGEVYLANNASRLDYFSSLDAMTAKIRQIEAEFAQIQREDSALVQTLRGTRNGAVNRVIKSAIEDFNHPLMGLCALTEEEERQVKSMLTSEGAKVWETRFSDPAGYEIRVGDIRSDQRAKFFALMQAKGLKPGKAGKVPGWVAKLGTQEEQAVFSSRFAQPEAALKEADRYADPQARRAEIERKCDADVATMLYLRKTETARNGISVAHAFHVIERYMHPKGGAEYAYDGKDRKGNADPKHKAVAGVAENYYGDALSLQRGVEAHLVSESLVALELSENLPLPDAVARALISMASNQTQFAWNAERVSLMTVFQGMQKKMESDPDFAKTVRDIAPAVHNNGYWGGAAGEMRKIKNPDYPLLGSHLNVTAHIKGRRPESDDNVDLAEVARIKKKYGIADGKPIGLPDIEPFLKDEVLPFWRGRTTLLDADPQSYPAGVLRIGVKGYQFSKEIFKSEEAMRDFYRTRGKTDAAINHLLNKEPKLAIINENAMHWSDALEAAEAYGKASEDRMKKMEANQVDPSLGAILLSEVNGLNRPLVDAFTRRLWRYIEGSWAGEAAYHYVPQIHVDEYLALSGEQRSIDSTVVAAALEALGLPAPPPPGVPDTELAPFMLDEKTGLPKDADLTKLELGMGDQVYVSVDGKWYQGKVVETNLASDLLDGRREDLVSMNGVLISLDRPSSHVIQAVSGMFMRPDEIKAEAERDPMSRRVFRKIGDVGTPQHAAAFGSDSLSEKAAKPLAGSNVLKELSITTKTAQRGALAFDDLQRVYQENVEHLDPRVAEKSEWIAAHLGEAAVPLIADIGIGFHFDEFKQFALAHRKDGLVPEALRNAFSENLGSEVRFVGRALTNEQRFHIERVGINTPAGDAGRSLVETTAAYLRDADTVTRSGSTAGIQSTGDAAGGIYLANKEESAASNGAKPYVFSVEVPRINLVGDRIVAPIGKDHIIAVDNEVKRVSERVADPRGKNPIVSAYGGVVVLR
jgi:hypothetical protein